MVRRLGPAGGPGPLSCARDQAAGRDSCRRSEEHVNTKGLKHELIFRFLLAVSRVYLDSYYLLEMIYKGDSYRDVKKLLYKIKEPAFEVFVPQIVLGEVVAKVFRQPAREWASTLSQLSKTLQDHGIDPDACLTPPQKDMAFEIMHYLSVADPRLDTTDIIILSHALADPCSKFFFTPDSKLVQNLKISEYEKKLRKEGKRATDLKISDAL